MRGDLPVNWGGLAYIIVKECILADYLKDNASEVVNMLAQEWDWKHGGACDILVMRSVFVPFFSALAILRRALQALFVYFPKCIRRKH